VGSAEVSLRHANFITAGPGGRARDVIDLMDLVEHRVHEAFGVRLEREVVVWRKERA
jgi:UDP-N-acetylmuramate dehydrogenase